jgi:hypothetical protein
VLQFPTNNRSEHVQLRVRSAGLWSPWANVGVLVSYTVPAVPMLAVAEDSTDGTISVQASHPPPAAGQPTVSHVDVWRREMRDGQVVAGTEIRVAKDRPPTSVYVHFAAHRQVYAYRVRAVAVNGTSSWSEWTAEPVGTVGFYGGGYEDGVPA